MNFIFTVISALILLFPTQNDVPYAKIESAFVQKNATTIVENSKNKILINILGKEGAYSKSQAVMVLKSFFNQVSPKDFNFTFKGKPSANGTFAIGNYICSDKNYRVTFNFKVEGQYYKIESITIETA